MLSYAFITLLHAKDAFICFRKLKCQNNNKKKTAGHVFTGFYLRKPVKNLQSQIQQLFTCGKICLHHLLLVSVVLLQVTVPG